jgi:hypothetical protein
MGAAAEKAALPPVGFYSYRKTAGTTELVILENAEIQWLQA